VNSQGSTIRTGPAILFEIAPMVTRFFYSHRENEGMSEALMGFRRTMIFSDEDNVS
jgi:hypothetical protein